MDRRTTLFSDSTRLPAVAGHFYPGRPERLKAEVESFLKPSPITSGVLGMVSPHAGYLYSGAVAGETFSSIEVPGKVVVLGPNHTGMGPSISIYSGKNWMLPFGKIAIDRDLAGRILDGTPDARLDESAHAREHSIEVQIPFLHYRKSAPFTFVPIVLSVLSTDACRKAGDSIAEAAEKTGGEVLIIASSDMTHYETHSAAKTKDAAAIEMILDLDPDGLMEVVSSREISMCGVIPAAVMLHAVKAMGATKARLIRYQTSGEISGNYEQVVGYAGIVVY